LHLASNRLLKAKDKALFNFFSEPLRKSTDLLHLSYEQLD
jgi:hypothetical protein